MPKSEKCQVAASVHIKHIPSMTKKGRMAIANWLKRLAKNIVDEPEIFAKTFRARYWY